MIFQQREKQNEDDAVLNRVMLGYQDPPAPIQTTLEADARIVLAKTEYDGMMADEDYDKNEVLSYSLLKLGKLLGYTTTLPKF